MPGGDIAQENLEQRIERIRKRDEEIEKRHREAEADRLAALQANAMVKTTIFDDDDWPKAHKYDKLDFTYDVKEVANEEAEKKSVDEPRLQRPFKKFPEGQGPPADPTYNFLAEPERDGKVPAIDKSIDKKKDWRSKDANVASNNTGPIARSNSNQNSFNRGKNGAKAKDAKPKAKPEATNNRKSDEQSKEEKMKRQKSIEGNWREKEMETESELAKVKAEMVFASDGKNDVIEAKSHTPNSPSIHQRLGTRSKNDANNLPDKLSGLSIEKRGNITVSVTKDGEVKSVKLDAIRAIGTGRVGNGSSIRTNVQPPNVQLQAHPQQRQQQQQQQQPQQQQQQHQQQQHQQQQPQHQHQQSFVAPQKPTVVMDSNFNALAANHTDYGQFELPETKQPITKMAQPKASNIVNGVPFKLPSIQDRLTKNRMYFDENFKNVQSESANK